MNMDPEFPEYERNRSFAEPPRRATPPLLSHPNEQDPIALNRDQTDDGPTEFSFGPRLVPRGRERALPEDGGKYRGTTPRRGRPSARDYDAPGHPGYRVR
ncbi:hypothetical protein [Mycolicibacter arupensis]|jgi:hypothetical protein|uniref:Uncharacterized protein n=1 Tax=Mycolicibacter arupensis TaxID=342002 RepID=A0A0F5MYT9_9MYCO|nr:hypothetical protein [Mycolicibacter arupensis]KKB99871.1 hypothetical protein WR43_07760 [Mycolicibacter arupensis]MCV7277177.1 hypothetical protein [Mycolicibacter arupensis]OQZ96884.1 hypothetical protein BST15_11470 [Mycolicibacter arupensis]